MSNNLSDVKCVAVEASPALREKLDRCMDVAERNAHLSSEVVGIMLGQADPSKSVPTAQLTCMEDQIEYIMTYLRVAESNLETLMQRL